MHPHQAPVGLLRERIECQPAREGVSCLLQFPGSLVPGREPLAEQLQAHLPLPLLLLDPLVKGDFLAQPEAIEEGTAHQGEGVLDVRDQRGALLKRGERGEPLGLLPGVLHHVQVQFLVGLLVQADQVTLKEQVAVLSRRGAGVGEQATQQRKAIA